MNGKKARQRRRPGVVDLSTLTSLFERQPLLPVLVRITKAPTGAQVCHLGRARPGTILAARTLPGYQVQPGELRLLGKSPPSPRDSPERARARLWTFDSEAAALAAAREQFHRSPQDGDLVTLDLLVPDDDAA